MNLLVMENGLFVDLEIYQSENKLHDILMTIVKEALDQLVENQP
jgi:hypothetical protein